MTFSASVEYLNTKCRRVLEFITWETRCFRNVECLRTLFLMKLTSPPQFGVLDMSHMSVVWKAFKNTFKGISLSDATLLTTTPRRYEDGLVSYLIVKLAKVLNNLHDNAASLSLVRFNVPTTSMCSSEVFILLYQRTNAAINSPVCWLLSSYNTYAGNIDIFVSPLPNFKRYLNKLSWPPFDEHNLYFLGPVSLITDLCCSPFIVI